MPAAIATAANVESAQHALHSAPPAGCRSEDFRRGRAFNYATGHARPPTDATPRPFTTLRAAPARPLRSLYGARGARGVRAAGWAQRGARSGRGDGDAQQRTQLRRCRLRGPDRPVHAPDRPADGEPVRNAGARSRSRRAQSPELRAGPADLVARVRGALHVRRARHPALSGRHPGDDAGRAGADGEHEPLLGAAHRGAARAVFDALRQRRRRRDRRLHRRWHAASRGVGQRGWWQLLELDGGDQGDGQRRQRDLADRLCRCGDALRHRGLSRALLGAARPRQCQGDARSRTVDAHHADRLVAIPARNAGSARPHPRPVGGRSAQRRSVGADVRHAQDHSPAAGRRGARPGARQWRRR